MHIPIVGVDRVLDLLEVECGPLNQKRDAFDPEQLMERYMDMRTNQGQFGSYHPNDLIQSIVDYFNRGNPQSVTNDQWGLFVYNPNAKMAQYMGDMHSPGNLGPQMDGHNDNQENVKSAEGSGFNPNVLNERLMESAFSKGSQFSSFGQLPAAHATPKGQANLGFDADSLNRKMMESAMKKELENGATLQGTTTPSTNTTNTSADHKTGQSTNQNPDSQMFGFNPDKLNAGLLDSFHTHGTEHGRILDQNSDQGHTRAMILGFNPDKLNADLIISLKYNPNSAMGEMSSVNGNSAMFGQTAHGAGTKSDPSIGQDNSSGSSPFTGITSIDGATGLTENSGQPETHNTGSHSFEVATVSGNQFKSGMTGNGGQPETHNTGSHNFEAATVSGNQFKSGMTGNGGQPEAHNTGSHTFDVSGNPFESGGANGKGSMTDMYNVNQSGAMPASGEMKVSRPSFEAGGIGPQGYGKKDSGVPPGVPSGSELKQTESATAKAHGIGGMG